MQATGIQWTDYSSNLLKYRRKSDGKTVWACVKTSPGCAKCYSEGIALRFNRGKIFNAASMEELEPFFDEGEAKKILTSKKLAGKKVFVDDMSDLFGSWVPDEIIDKHFAVFSLRPDVTFQVLTKRAELMLAYTQSIDGGGPWNRTRCYHFRDSKLTSGVGRCQAWPLPNVWCGVSAEDQARWDERTDLLRQVPAAVRFVSAEPLLGTIDPHYMSHPGPSLSNFQWVIVGGESGRGARPCELDWIRAIVEKCKAAKVACFVKQLGSVPVYSDAGVRWPSGLTHDPHPLGLRVRLKDGKGGDMAEWPESVRVRQMPAAV